MSGRTSHDSSSGARPFRTLTDSLALLSDDARVFDAAARVATRERCYVAGDPAQLFALVGTTRPRVVVVDGAHPEADDVLHRVNGLHTRANMLVVLVYEVVAPDPPPGADLVVELPALGEALLLANTAVRIHHRPVALHHLLGLSLLPGPLDRALDDVADRLASGFGVDRCLLSVRGDSSGGGAAATRTWSQVTWSRTAERCRSAVASGTTLITPGAEDTDAPAFESFLAVPLATPLAKNGFLGLVAARPRIFSREVRVALQAIASRLSSELGWRQVHERTTEELDRVSSGPGVDPLLGIWNRAAIDQLAAMQVAAARRTGFALAAAVIDVVDLQAINNRHGLEVGDRVLRRVADAVRTTVREEDIVGRWSGDKIAIVLHNVSDQALRVVDRLRAAIAARPLELAVGGVLAIPVSAGVAHLQQGEDAARLVARAAQASRAAMAGAVVIAGERPKSSHDSTPPPRISQQLDAVAEEIATTIGGSYKLLHEISRGGMGVVYRAHDRSLERPVAIKMLRPDLAEDRELVERFRIEAAMLAHLQHPNLVQIYSFGHHGGDSYFVMELVEGESLEQAIDRHALERTAISLLEIPVIIEQIASALDALHDRGVVHRDVKPANVIRDPFRNRSVLVDVGIARRYGQAMPSAGTPGFIAPEVFGDGEATPRSDVYGLAATAYAALTLARPWGEGELMTILARQCNEAPRPPSSHRPELACVDELFASALSSDPQRRPTSAGSFARALSANLMSLAPRVEASDAARPQAREPELTAAAIGAARTRGVVFRSMTRAVGVREAERLRDALGGDHPDLAGALYETAPLSWLPTDLLVRLLAVAPDLVGRERGTLARDVARATVRASFRRFFPASAATLVPERTLSAIRNVWGRYQSWGTISSMPVQTTEVVVRLADALGERALCEWTGGMLEQLVILSGGKAPSVRHDACTSDGADACMFRVTWASTD